MKTIMILIDVPDSIALDLGPIGADAHRVAAKHFGTVSGVYVTESVPSPREAIARAWHSAWRALSRALG